MNRSEIMDLFDREDNFIHGVISRIEIGPRKAITLDIKPLDWVGPKGSRDRNVLVRFGNILDFQSTASWFQEFGTYDREVAFIGPASGADSFRGGYCEIRISAERRPMERTFSVGSITIIDHNAQQVAAGNVR